MRTLKWTDVANVDDLQVKTVEVPEWNGEVVLRQLSAAEVETWEMEMEKRKDPKTGKVVDLKGASVSLLRRCLVERAEDGSYTPMIRTGADAEALGRKSALVLGRLAKEAMKLNGATEKDLEGVLGNSAGTTAVGGGSELQK